MTTATHNNKPVIMHNAINDDNSEALATMISAKTIDINHRLYPTRSTLLHSASWRGSLKCVKVLINAGADVNAKDWYDLTPLHCACTESSLACAKVLVEANANVNAPSNSGRTSLHYACKTSHRDGADIVQLLLEAGADATIKDNGGQLPIDLAYNKEIKHIVNGFGGGRATKVAAESYE